MNTSTMPVRERGYLLIADMESSTMSKFVLSELDAFEALSRHNGLIMSHCHAAAPTPGIVLNSLGDAVVVKFPVNGDPAGALRSCLTAARDIVAAFEALSPIATLTGGEFHLRTKLLLQSYDAFCYGRREPGAGFADELVGADIDLAFRLAPVAWRLQVLVTTTFMRDVLAHAKREPGTPGDPGGLLDEAHVARHGAALTAGPLRGVSHALHLDDLDLWVTDAREIGRLKGLEQTREVFALTFESPESLSARGAVQRLTIKVRQHHHAIILASISLTGSLNDNYIGHIVEKLREPGGNSALDSELTLLAAAKIYGEFDFFFRVSSIDDESLRRFFHAVRADSFGVSHLEVRSAVGNRFAITRRYAQIFERFAGQPYEIVLTWFEPVPGRNVFDELRACVDRRDDNVAAVEILEVGEVIHRTPVYAIFICASLRDYAAFFTQHGLTPTACRSHVGHISRPGDAQLRYSLQSGVYLPRGPLADGLR